MAQMVGSLVPVDRSFPIAPPLFSDRPTAGDRSVAEAACQGNFSTSAKSTVAAARTGRKTAKSNPTMAAGEGDPPYMKGRLRARLSFWKTFCQSSLVLSWIQFGFPLLWNHMGEPPSMHFKNHHTATANGDFVTSTISELVLMGCLEKVFSPPHCISPLGVAFKASNNKPRLIFDARYINEHCVCPSFIYEDLGCINQFILPNDYMVTTDYSKGYHHLDIHEDYWKYFGIEWNGEYYVYTTMPFGLASACWAFTKLTRELRNKWRRLGRRCGTYLDDGIHGDACPHSLSSFVSNHLIPDTTNCGFILNMLKSKFIPSQVRDYLGMIVDTVRGHLRISTERHDNIINMINSLIKNKHNCSVHSVEIVAGNLISARWAFGRLARLMTMSLYSDIKRASSRREYIQLSDTTIHDLNWWLCCFNAYNGFRPLWQPPGFHMTFYTDAAGMNLKNFGGWAGWTKDHTSGRIRIAEGVWTRDLALQHSTFQELTAIFKVIQSFNNNGHLSGKRVLIKTDNEGVTFIINKGGSRDDITHAVCKDLLRSA